MLMEPLTHLAGDDLGNAAYGDVVGLFTGSTGYLNADGTVSVPPNTTTYPDAGIPVSLGEAGWDDSLSFTELVQSLPGSDLATQLDGEDLGVASLSVDPASAPGISGEDAESGDENQTIWNIYGDATTTTAGAVVSDLFFQHKDGGDASGVLTTFAWMDGSENIFNFNVPVSAPIPTATDADAHTLTSAEYHGGSVLATGAGVYTLPAAPLVCLDALRLAKVLRRSFSFFLLPVITSFLKEQGERLQRR